MALHVKRGLKVIFPLLALWVTVAHGEPSSSSSLDIERLERKLHVLLQSYATAFPDVPTLLRLADLYLDLGDAYQEEPKRRAAYEDGARLAQKALTAEPSNADAHYLYAANLGSAAQLNGVMASALTINEIKSHVRRALELKPDHAQALHMMGRLLEELPWFLGGDEAAALSYLQQAVMADPHDVHARLDLAKTYLKHQNAGAARKELTAILRGEVPVEQSAQRYREEAHDLLHSLQP